jgi:diadenylate cyclase
MREGRTLGMRHKAGLGISEQADVISVIVSEETGSISVAENGVIKFGLSRESLRNYLQSSLKISREKGFKGLLESWLRNKK